ncbi:TPA: HAD family hydrolase [Vibrio harveyi]
MNFKKQLVILLITTLGLTATASASQTPLPSWNDSQLKQDIITFVLNTTDRTNKQYQPEYKRIAVFDNDGTLWNEKPTYIHVQATLHTLEAQLKKDNTLATKQPWATIAKGKLDLSHYGQLLNIESFGLNSVLEQLIGVPYAGMTSTAYQKSNEQFLKEWKHPKYKVGYKRLTYKPMKELINYLQKNKFKVYIYTADEVDFLRPLAKDLYNIPAENVFGTSFNHDLTFENGKGVLTRTSQVDWINNWAHKTALIQRTFGEIVPLIAVGNSNGDEQMLHYTASHGGLSLWLHHDDAKREDKYDKHTDKLMKLTNEGIINPIDMSTEWATVFDKTE